MTSVTLAYGRKTPRRWRARDVAVLLFVSGFFVVICFFPVRRSTAYSDAMTGSASSEQRWFGVKTFYSYTPSAFEKRLVSMGITWTPQPIVEASFDGGLLTPSFCGRGRTPPIRSSMFFDANYLQSISDEDVRKAFAAIQSGTPDQQREALFDLVVETEMRASTRPTSGTVR